MTDTEYDPAYAWNEKGGWLSPEVNDPQYNAGLNTELLVRTCTFRNSYRWSMSSDSRRRRSLVQRLQSER